MSTTNYVQYMRKAFPTGTPCDCDPKMTVPGWVFDMIAEQKLTGGYKLKVRGQSNVCGVCHLTRSVNGTCGC
jgi:hypothetical protein